MPVPPAPPALVPDYVWLERRVSAALQSSRCPLARFLPRELVLVIASFLWSPLTSVSRQLDNPGQRAMWSLSLAICTGWIHADTQQYDDWNNELRGRVMAGWRLRAIECYGDRYLNGFSFTYCGPTGDTWSTEVRKGSHHRPSMSRLQLASGEAIVQVAVRVSKWMECCVFETSAGRRFQVGGRGSRWQPKEKHASEWTHAGVTQLLLMPHTQPRPHTDQQTAAEETVAATYEALAFTYGIGGHVHNLGVYYQPLWPTQPHSLVRPHPPPVPSAAPSTGAPRPTMAASLTTVPPPSSIALTENVASAASVVWSGPSYLTPNPTTTRLQPLLSSS